MVVSIPRLLPPSRGCCNWLSTFWLSLGYLPNTGPLLHGHTMDTRVEVCDICCLSQPDMLEGFSYMTYTSPTYNSFVISKYRICKVCSQGRSRVDGTALGLTWSPINHHARQSCVFFKSNIGCLQLTVSLFTCTIRSLVFNHLWIGLWRCQDTSQWGWQV